MSEPFSNIFKNPFFLEGHLEALEVVPKVKKYNINNKLLKTVNARRFKLLNTEPKGLELLLGFVISCLWGFSKGEIKTTWRFTRVNYVVHGPAYSLGDF